MPVFRIQIEAETEEKAKEEAEKLAYEDTWCSNASWSGCKFYSSEEVTAEGLPLIDHHDDDQGYDEYKEERAGLI